MAGATYVTSHASTLADGNGSVAIEALRYFAVAAATPDTIDLGFVRNNIATTVVTISNSAVVDEISDNLVTTVVSSPSQLTFVAPGALAAGQTGTVEFIASDPGNFTSTINLGFSSHATIGADVVLPGKTIAVTGTATDVAYAILHSSGTGQLSLSGQGNYGLNLGNIVAGSTALSQLSVSNGVTASAYSESLFGSFGELVDDGFSFTPTGFGNLSGGGQVGVGPVSFNSTGLSLGLHWQTFDFLTLSHFAGLEDFVIANTQITVMANVVAAPPVAGVPEPATWGLLTGGFGMIGAAMRRKRRFA